MKRFPRILRGEKEVEEAGGRKDLRHVKETCKVAS